MFNSNLDHIKRAEAARESERQQFRAGLDALEKQAQTNTENMVAGLEDFFKKRTEAREALKGNVK